MGVVVSVLKKKKITKIFVVGDFNIDIPKSCETKNLLGIFEKFDLHLMNGHLKTRVTNSTSTTIDLIFSGPGPLPDFSCAAEPVFLSDHESVFFELSANIPKETDKFIECRVFPEDNIVKFEHYLYSQSWQSVVFADTVDAKYAAFLRIFLIGFWQFFPLKRKIVRSNQKTRVPLSRKIKSKRRELISLHPVIRSLPPGDPRKEAYKQQKKQFSRDLQNEIKASNSSFIARAENKSKAAWAVVNKTLGRVNERVQIDRINLGANVISDSKQIADELNRVFIVPRPEHGEEREYNFQGAPAGRNMFLVPAGVQEMLLILRQLPNKQSAGWDEVPIFLAKRVAASIAAPLADIVNCSFSTGTFPQLMKTAVVSPLFKKGDRLLANNYRPIAVLPTFSKILENSYLLRLASFFAENNLIPKSQHGFVRGKSTVSALFEYFVHLYELLDRKQKALGIFYDFSNAFGTVHIPLVLRKFERCGVRGLALEWLESALTGRTQVVKIRALNGKNEINVYSEERQVVRGTPQGGIISPFVFVGSVYDISFHLALGLMINFADDTSELISSSNNETLIMEARIAAGCVEQYCVANFLTLNASKSVILQYRHPNAPRANSSPLVTVGGNSVCCMEVTKFLGLYVTETLNWNEHADHVIGKLHSAVFMVNSLLKIVDEKTLLSVYYALAQSVIQYGIVIWGCSEQARELVFVAQKRLLRAMAGERYWPGLTPVCSARPLFRKFNILPVFSIFLLESCLFVRKFPHYFVRTNDVHQYATRGKCDLYLPVQTAAICRQNPLICASRLYNELPVSIRVEWRFPRFVTLMKEFVHRHNFYDEQEFFSLQNSL